MTAKPMKFCENIAIVDNRDWVWNLIKSSLSATESDYLQLPSNLPIRQSWSRFRNAKWLIVHWESSERKGGAIIEEILDVQPTFNVGEKVIVVTTNPTHEDVIYLAELGVRKVVRARNRDKELKKSLEELKDHLLSGAREGPRELSWRRLLHAIDSIPEDVNLDAITRLENTLVRMRSDAKTARYLDAYASLRALKSEDGEAINAWSQALEKNPNYFRTYGNLINFYRSRSRYQDALALMQKMQELNREKISRMVGMGEIHLTLQDKQKAEFYFKSALERDNYCSGALNGLAELRFEQGDLEGSRRLLARSSLAYKAASKLNKIGIELVRASKYEEALDLYTKAQYVLPQQDKGSLLFFNIGLCYYRWEKHNMAIEFFKIALIKDPTYQKAQKLLQQAQHINKLETEKRAG